MNHHSYAPVLLPVLLGARIILDVISIGTGYRLDFAYFLVFLLAGVFILATDSGVFWGFLAIAMALFSFGNFLLRGYGHSACNDGHWSGTADHANEASRMSRAELEQQRELFEIAAPRRAFRKR